MCVDVASLLLVGVVVVASSKQPFYLFYFSASLIVVRFKLGSAMMMASQRKAQHALLLIMSLVKTYGKTVFFHGIRCHAPAAKATENFLNRSSLIYFGQARAHENEFLPANIQAKQQNHKVIIVGRNDDGARDQKSALSQCWKRDVRKMNSPKTKAKE